MNDEDFLYEQERLNDFLELLPENLNEETKMTINNYIAILIDSITIAEKKEWLSEEWLTNITKILINSFKQVVQLLINKD